MIYFLHIPKTAGQSLATRIASAFPPGRSKILVPVISTREELQELAARYDMLGAHTAQNVLAHRPPGMELMVAVRDPVEQIVSLYRHIRRDPLNPIHAASLALPPRLFIERFAGHFFNFQTRSLVTPFNVPTPADWIAGEEAWLLRRLADVAPGIRWLFPTERTDEFCALWSVETGRPLGQPNATLNQVADDNVDAPALRAWLLQRPERFAVDSLLWAMAQRRYADWRDALLSRSPATGDAAPGAQAWASNGAGVWLVRDWHPPEKSADGGTDWWAGPGLFPRIRLRRGPYRLLRFDVMVLLGVHWNRIRLFCEADMGEVPFRGALDLETQVVRFEADIGRLGPDETLVLFTQEDISKVPPVPLALRMPRRSFVARNWSLE
jgi:hypothetical protein